MSQNNANRERVRPKEAKTALRKKAPAIGPAGITAQSPYSIRDTLAHLKSKKYIARKALAWMANGRVEHSLMTRRKPTTRPPEDTRTIECVAILIGSKWEIWQEHEVRGVLINPVGTPKNQRRNFIPFEGSISDRRLDIFLHHPQGPPLNRLEQLYNRLSTDLQNLLDHASHGMPGFAALWDDAHPAPLNVSVTTEERTLPPDLGPQMTAPANAEPPAEQITPDAQIQLFKDQCIHLEYCLNGVKNRLGIELNPQRLELDPVFALEFGIGLGLLQAKAEAILSLYTDAALLAGVGHSTRKPNGFWPWVLKTFEGKETKTVYSELDGLPDPENPAKKLKITSKGLRRHDGTLLKQTSFDATLRRMRAAQKKCNARPNVTSPD